MKDQAIKLFGKEIPLPVKDMSGGEDGEDEHMEEVEKDLISDESKEIPVSDSGENLIEDEGEESATAKPDGDDDRSSTGKPLKKPDKILPCPRCKSMDTKFCYYNNYNVNQPRHFCKSCQRYWTSGGTMRNVPVGAGRRKNKNSMTAAISNCRPITISDAFQAAQMGIVHHTGFNPNTTILSFELEPMRSVMSHSGAAAVAGAADRKKINKDHSNSNPNNELTVAATTTIHPPPPPHPPIPYLAGVPWPSYHPLPAYYPNGIPSMPVVPTQYWNCSYPNSWPIQSWLSPPPPPPPYTTILGKHSREGEIIKPSETSIVIPKTLRIDDPDEAARSSIWTTLGIKNDSIKRGSLFKGFESKDGEMKKKEGDETAATEASPSPSPSPAMMANPAALCRSVRLQEGF